MLMSRRSLLKNLVDNISENVKSSLPEIIKATQSKTENIEKKEWISIGNISDFPPECSVPINKNFYIISKYEGFYALSIDSYLNNNQNPRLMLKIENNGSLLLNPKERTPDDSVLSVLTGEFVFIEE